MPRYELPEGRAAIMGILNVTPDSFSDGGKFASPTEAVKTALTMLDHGADVIDVGGESTRPGALPVSAAEELERVLPVVKQLVSHGVTVSVDTSKAQVAHPCLEAGASIINDVTALSDPAMLDLCVVHQPTVCLMHMQGDPRTMQREPVYKDVVREVSTFLVERAITIEEAGLSRGCIWIDPGIGFGKTVEHNLELLGHTGTLVETGYPVLIGVSRKSFIAKVTESGGPLDRLEGTLAAEALAQYQGVKIIRTHDVKASKRTSLMVAAVVGSERS